MYQYPCVQKIPSIELPKCMYSVNPVSILQHNHDKMSATDHRDSAGTQHGQSSPQPKEQHDHRKLLSTLAHQEKLIQRICELEKQVNSLSLASDETSPGESPARAAAKESTCPVYPKVIKELLDRQDKLIKSIDLLTQQVAKKLNLSPNDANTLQSQVQSVKQKSLDVALHVNLDNTTDLIPIHKFLLSLVASGMKVLATVHLSYSGSPSNAPLDRSQITRWAISTGPSTSRSQYDLTVSIILHSVKVTSNGQVQAIIDTPTKCIQGSENIISSLAQTLKVNSS